MPRAPLAKPAGVQQAVQQAVALHQQGRLDDAERPRYAPLLAARGAKVVLEVQGSLKPLLSALASVSAIADRGEPLPPFDLHCPLMSLPLAFKTALDTVRPLTCLAASNPRGPPLSVVLALWLSITPAEGTALRPIARRARRTNARLIRRQMR